LYRHSSQKSAAPSRGVPQRGHSSAAAVGSDANPGGDGDDGGAEAGDADDEEYDDGGCEP